MLLSLTRVWLPAALVVAGIVAIVLGGDSPLGATGVGLMVIAVIVWMVNWMFRMSVESNLDREREEAARVYFDEHGRWPDEEE